MVRWWVLLAGFLAVLALWWLWWRGEDPLGEEHPVLTAVPDANRPKPHPASRGGAVSEPEVELKGRGTAAAERAVGPASPTGLGPRSRATSPGVAVGGRVLDEVRRPLAGATVYALLREQLYGADRGRAVTTGEDGRFRLPVRIDGAGWLCARAPGRLNHFVELGDVAPDRSIDLVLEEAPTLEVRLEDESGEPFADGEVHAVPLLSHGPVPRLPGPLSSIAEQVEFTDEAGVATFQFAAAVPVTLVPAIEGFLAVPTEQEAPRAEGNFAFQVRRGTTLRIEVVDAETGQPIRESIWVVVLDEYGVERGTFNSDTKDGTLETDLALHFGIGCVEVTAVGREPALVGMSGLRKDGETLTGVVPMKPLREPGTLRIDLPAPPSSAPPARAWRPGRCDVLTRRTDGDWVHVGWRRTKDVSYGDGALRLSLRPGIWDVVVAERVTGEVILLHSVPVASGGETRRRGPARPGVRFPLYDVLPADLVLRGIRVLIPRLGWFPVVGRQGLGALRSAQDLVRTVAPAGSPARSDPKQGAHLGPYPGPHVILQVSDLRRTHDLHVRGP